ncbi:MAG: site-specific DNA-methyltransferase, partial [candidate division WOR-3 bacterium]
MKHLIETSWQFNFKEPLTANYRPIKIELGKTLSEKEMKVISRLENIFPKTDFFFKTNGHELIFYLREIDLLFFRNTIKKLAVENNLNETENIFNKLISNIEAIKSYGLKGRKRLYVGYNKERKVKSRKEKEIRRGVYFYALNHNFSKKNNELPNQFVNRIICGDSEGILKKVPDNCIDLIFTSPPYNFGLDYENHKDGISWYDYIDKLFAIFKECIRVL